MPPIAQPAAGLADTGGMSESAPRALRVTVTIGASPPRVLELASPVLCGSARAADVRIADGAVAPLMLRLTRDGDAVAAVAVAPGVSVDGQPLPVDRAVPVAGREVALGPARLVVAPWDQAPATDPARTDSLARRLMRDLLGNDEPPPPELVVEAGPAAGQRLVLPAVGAQVVIGRGDSGWVVLDPDLSRAHAVVEHRADGVWIRDLDSKNGTRVNGVVAPTSGAGLVLADGAVVTLGKTTLRFRDPAAAALGGVEALLAAETHTRRTEAGPAVAVPPRWPIIAAAVVAAAAFALVLALLFTGTV